MWYKVVDLSTLWTQIKTMGLVVLWERLTPSLSRDLAFGPRGECLVAYKGWSCENGGDLGWWGGWRAGGFNIWGTYDDMEAETK